MTLRFVGGKCPEGPRNLWFEKNCSSVRNFLDNFFDELMKYFSRYISGYAVKNINRGCAEKRNQ